jgi:hypothetical protein
MLFGTYFEFLFLSPEKKTWGIIHYVFVAFLILTTNNFNSQLCAHEKISPSLLGLKSWGKGTFRCLWNSSNNNNVQSAFHLKIY